MTKQDILPNISFLFCLLSSGKLQNHVTQRICGILVWLSHFDSCMTLKQNIFNSKNPGREKKSMANKKDVLIYDGEGSSEESVLMAWHTFTKVLDHSSYNVRKISPEFLLKGTVVSDDVDSLMAGQEEHQQVPLIVVSGCCRWLAKEYGTAGNWWRLRPRIHQRIERPRNKTHQEICREWRFLPGNLRRRLLRQFPHRIWQRRASWSLWKERIELLSRYMQTLCQINRNSFV